jgi:hypothetical protein
VSACAECGYRHDSLGRAQIVLAVPALAEQHRELLCSVPPERLREHTRPGSWSATEYGCHVRDMLRIQRDRVILAQSRPTPEFASLRRDERAVQERYNDQDPVVVAAELVEAARLLAATLSGLPDPGWLRTGMYPWPEPAERTVEWIGQRTTHELAHHLFDERRLLGRA